MNSPLRRPLAALFAATALAATLPAQVIKPATSAGRQVDTKAERTQLEIVKLLNDFMEHVDESAMHDRFWAEDLIYTGSAGTVQSKADIMKSVRESEKKAADGATGNTVIRRETYLALEPVVRLYGDTIAALTFRLVRHASDGKTIYYRNSGLLILRSGKWQVATWQATKILDDPAK